MKLIELSLFFFVLLGSKLLLGGIVVYLLLPRDARCVLCDAEMLPLAAARGTERLLRLLRLQRRWCMECRRTTLGRRLLLRRSAVREPLPVVQPRLR
jgi:hypothetical protein